MRTKHEDKSRLVARIVRAIAAEESFETMADLTDALKFRLARLRIRWHPDDLDTALRIVASNTDIVHCDHKFIDSSMCLKCGWFPPVRDLVRADTAPAISRDEASAILQRLGIRL